MSCWRFCCCVCPRFGRKKAFPLTEIDTWPSKSAVKDLVSRMTVEEKARQLDMYNGCESFLDKDRWLNWTHAKPDAVLNPQLAEKCFGTLGAGSIHDLYPRPKLYNAVQSW